MIFNKKYIRYISIFIIVFISFSILISRVFYLQVVKGQEFLSQSKNRISRNNIITAPRGEILDRYGRSLVRNRQGFSVFVEDNKENQDEFNKALIELALIFEKAGVPFTNTFPIAGIPFEFTTPSNELLRDADFSGFIKNKIDGNNLSAPEIIARLSEYYNITSLSDKEKITIIGIRYELEKNGKGSNLTYEFARDIPISLVSIISENFYDKRFIYVESSYIREYVYENFGGHILGTVGKIFAEEYKTLKNEGYYLNDYIGKDGIEKSFEKYIKGVNGLKQTKTDISGVISETNITKEAIAGNNVVLTIDRDVQMAAENSINSKIPQIRNSIPNGSPGFDAKGASVVVVDVNSGEILALANYPTINLKGFDFATLSADPLKPLINRAISSAYPSGSTFKLLTAIAGLESGAITPSFTYNCGGVYRYYPSYQPTCFRGHAHGVVDVANAIRLSCNGFFFDTGRLTGVEKLREYGTLFGFGQNTGIEILGETKGVLAGPEYKALFGQQWWSGDTIQMAIGQSDNLISTLQLANYVSTIATDGKRYKTHIVKSVKEFSSSTTILESTPEIVANIPLKVDTINAVRSGMTLALAGGSVAKYFFDSPVTVAGKTGTAQVPNGSSNGTFVCYAPIQNPQIAIAICGENIGEGGFLAPIARDIINVYFAPKLPNDPIFDIGSVN